MSRRRRLPRPVERREGRPGEPGVLHSNQIEVGKDTKESADDPAVEVLVGEVPDLQRKSLDQVAVWLE